MKYNIIDIAWRSAAHTVGFVAYATLNPANPGEWNSVVGYKPELRIIDTFTGDVLLNVTSSQAEDAQYIAAHGAKIEWLDHCADCGKKLNLDQQQLDEQSKLMENRSCKHVCDRCIGRGNILKDEDLKNVELKKETN